MAYLEFLRSNRGHVYDSLLLLKAKGTVATSMVGESPVGTDKYIDTGGGRTRGDVVVNVYAIGSTLACNTLFALRLQGSKNSSFTTGVDLVITEIGKANMLTGYSSLATNDVFGVGRYIVPFTNDYDDTVYRYLRHYISVDCSYESSVGTTTVTTISPTANHNLQYEYYLSDIIT